MDSGFRPMEIQSKVMRAELAQHPVPALHGSSPSVTSSSIPSSGSKPVIVKRIKARSSLATSDASRSTSETQIE